VCDDAGPKLFPEEQELRAEIQRLKKISSVLMDRAERSTKVQGSDFGMFQTTIMLEEQVRRRTEELETALHENEKITAALRESEAKFRGLVNQSLAGIAIIEEGRFTYANARLAEMFGYSEKEILSLTPIDVTTRADRRLVAEQIRRRLSGEVDRVSYVFHGLRKNGAVLDIECHSSVMETRGRAMLINLMIDVTERVRVECEVLALQDQLREQAIRDALTGLYNRLPLNEFFDRELSLAKRHGRSISLVMADLDHFKAVNDTFGHLGGDEALRVFATLLRSAYRASDIHCRYGGEEFLILLPGMVHEAACARTELLRSTLECTSIKYSPSSIHMTATFGVATYPQHADTRDAMIAAADQALYAGKTEGRNRVRSYCREVEGVLTVAPAEPRR
jgi:diguanylate cyclase (GGDEF)-like protein/PAS domain S-box-containing protein